MSKSAWVMRAMVALAPADGDGGSDGGFVVFGLEEGGDGLGHGARQGAARVRCGQALFQFRYRARTDGLKPWNQNPTHSLARWAHSVSAKYFVWIRDT